MQTPGGYHDTRPANRKPTDPDEPNPRLLNPVAREGYERARARQADDDGENIVGGWVPMREGPDVLTSDGRVLQAPDAPLFGSKSPLTAGTLRGALFATVGLLITMALVLLESQTGILPEWWPAVLTPLLIQILRIWEAYIDQIASG